jgi:hypothetical protein
MTNPVHLIPLAVALLITTVMMPDVRAQTAPTPDVAPDVRAGFDPMQTNDHVAACHWWQDVGERVYASYWSKTKYGTFFSFGASQAKDEEATARAAGWNEPTIQQLLRIVADAQDDKWDGVSLDQFGTQVFNSCIAAWQASSTPEERASEEAEVKKRQAQEDASRVVAVEQMQRNVACTEYRTVAMSAFMSKTNGMSFESELDRETAKAYGPNGEVLRYSSENEKVIEGVVEAAYSNNPAFGSNTYAFGDYAYKLCMNGERF